MTQDKSSYQQIVKSTSLFGGVQVFQILIQIIRSKFIAVLLGPTGMGIQGLLASTLSLIAWLTNFGLGTSAIKYVSEANASGDNARVGTIVGVLRRLVWITGLLGVLVTICLSSWFSQITFGNKEYTLAFVLISITLLFNQISTGQSVILRGTRKIKYMAQSSLLGSLFGLLISIPIFYLLGIDGIVPTIIISSVVSLFFSWLYSKKVKVDNVQLSLKITIDEGRDMLRMGFMLSLSALITIAASYLVRIYISNSGSIEDVGLYTAGFAVISTYVGLVFTAMGTDYYPRLSAIAHDNKQASILINQQSEVSILIIGPILSVFLIFIHWIVILLYSPKFIAIDGMIHYAALGMFFKAATSSVGFIFLAKGDSKVFLFSELFSTTFLLILNLLGYHYLGLTGMGVSFLISYVIALFQIFIIAKIKYKFSFSRDFYKIFIFQLTIGILCFLCNKLINKPLTYFVGIPLIGLSLFHSFKELDRRIGLIIFIKKIKYLYKNNSSLNK